MSEPSEILTHRVALAPFGVVTVAFLCGVVSLAVEFGRFAYPLSATAFVGMTAGFTFILAICLLPFVAAQRIGTLSSLSPTLRKWLGACVAGLPFGVPLKWLGDSLIQGGWVSQQSWAPAVPWILATAGVAGIIGIARVGLGARFLKPLAWAAGLGGVALVVADLLVLPNLYPTPHFAVRLAGQLLLTLASWGAVSRLRSPRVSFAIGAAGALLMLAGIALWLKLPQSLNMELSFRGGVATNMASLLVTEALPSTPIVEIVGAKVPWTARVQVQPRARAKHVVLLLVDTLRADALSPAREEPGARKLVRSTDTPFLNKFMAEECSVFRRAYAQAPATHRSIPPTFRSIEAWENSLKTGTALGTYLTQQKVSTYAVVNDYFVLPYYAESSALLQGFDDVGVYFPRSQDSVLELAKERFSTHLGAQPSFGWVHFLAPHFPGWNGKPLNEMQPRPRYREAVKWMDFAIKTLVDDLRQKGALDDTAIIIASDHGEGLGDNGTWNHGPNVWEEELRVPLAVCLPGQKGAVIERTVGNIDLQPTILDVMGLPPLETARGRSLMPLLDQPDSTWEMPYYVQNFDSSLAAVIYGGQKLIYRPRTGAYSRYDLQSDPDELTSLFDSDSKLDRELQMLLVHWNPKLVAGAVRKDDTATLATVLDAWNGDQWDPKLGLSLELAALSDEPAIRAVVTRLWERSSDDLIRFWIMRSMRTKGWLLALVKSRLASLDSDQKVRFVRFMADAHLSPMEPEWVMKQLRSISNQHDELWIAWMRLIITWRLNADSWNEPVIELIRKGATFPSLEAQAAAFWPLDALQVDEPDPQLIEELAKHHDSRFPQARAAAIRYLGLTKDPRFVPMVRSALPAVSVPFIVRRQAVIAIAALEGRAAVPLLLESMNKDELLTVDAIKSIGATGDLETLKTLRTGIHYGYYPYIDPEIKRLESKK